MSKKRLSIDRSDVLAFDEEATALSIKASLFRTLQKALKETPGTQSALAVQLNIPQPKVSDIINGKMSGFSIERLANFLLRLNYDIRVDARPASPGKSGRVIFENIECDPSLEVRGNAK